MRLRQPRRFVVGLHDNSDRENPFSNFSVLPTQSPRELPCAAERELVQAVLESALHALGMPTDRGRRMLSPRTDLRLNAIAWVMGFTRNPPLSFDFCSTILGGEPSAMRIALTDKYRITEAEIALARDPHAWRIGSDKDRRRTAT